jgi:hypothetical protein
VLTSITQHGNSRAIQGTSVRVTRNSRAMPKPTSATQRDRTPVRNPIINVTSMNTAAIFRA